MKPATPTPALMTPTAQFMARLLAAFSSPIARTSGRRADRDPGVSYGAGGMSNANQREVPQTKLIWKTRIRRFAR